MVLGEGLEILVFAEGVCYLKQLTPDGTRRKERAIDGLEEMKRF